jgi:hypothetical protein
MAQPNRPPQPTRFAIQKARGKGWTTLEVGEGLDQTQARFDRMVQVNPRAYFRLIQLEFNPDSGYEGMEFNWTLIQLHDPADKGNTAGKGNKGGKRPKAARGAGSRRRGAGEKVGLPLRFYLGVVVVGLLLAVAAFLAYGGPGPGR